MLRYKLKTYLELLLRSPFERGHLEAREGHGGVLQCNVLSVPKGGLVWPGSEEIKWIDLVLEVKTLWILMYINLFLGLKNASICDWNVKVYAGMYVTEMLN